MKRKIDQKLKVPMKTAYTKAKFERKHQLMNQKLIFMLDFLLKKLKVFVKFNCLYMRQIEHKKKLTDL